MKHIHVDEEIETDCLALRSLTCSMRRRAEQRRVERHQDILLNAAIYKTSTRDLRVNVQHGCSDSPFLLVYLYFLSSSVLPRLPLLPRRQTVALTHFTVKSSITRFLLFFFVSFSSTHLCVLNSIIINIVQNVTKKMYTWFFCVSIQGRQKRITMFTSVRPYPPILSSNQDSQTTATIALK